MKKLNMYIDNESSYMDQGVWSYMGLTGKFYKYNEDNRIKLFLTDLNCRNEYNPNSKLIELGSFNSTSGAEKSLNALVFNMSDIYRGPLPGDIITFLTNEWYARKKGELATIESIDNGDLAYICCGASGGHHQLAHGHSISGGPWRHVNIKNLIDQYHWHELTCWNWGTNGSGAGQGVYFKKRVKIWGIKDLSLKEVE